MPERRWTAELWRKTWYEHDSLGPMVRTTRGLDNYGPEHHDEYDTSFPDKLSRVTVATWQDGSYKTDLAGWQGWANDYHPAGSPAPTARWGACSP